MAPPAGKEVAGQRLDNQPYDLAVDVNDSEEIESDEEDDEVGAMEGNNAPGQAVKQQQPASLQKMENTSSQKAMKKGGDDEEEDDDDKEVPGTYNPNDYANLQVASDVKDLFEYIQRYKPQKIDLETKLKPFIPDFVPAVGEVDAFLKMPKPDGTKEDLGIAQLDEPALNCEDKTVLELKYVQVKNVVRATPMNVNSIDSAEKKPKEITRWIGNV